MSDFEQNTRLGIPKSTVGPLIALVSTCIGALTAVLVILSKDGKEQQ